MIEQAIPTLALPSGHLCASPAWSSGYFDASGPHPPQACLQHCLQGNPERAAILGCDHLRALLRAAKCKGSAANAGSVADTALPEVCARGYHVHVATPAAPGEPHVLVLHPPPGSAAEAEATRPVIEALCSAARENWRIHRENDGLAGEILQCYEQINLIFDISSEVAVLTEGEDVRRVLMLKLRQIYTASSAFYVDERADVVLQLTADDRFVSGRLSQALAAAADPKADTPGDSGEEGLPTSSRPEPVLPPGIDAVLARLRETPQVLASSEGNEALAEQGLGTSIWGPLRQGPSSTAAIGFVRRDRPFEAGDMLLLDSTLTFGGHILSNMQLAERLQRASFEAVRALVNAIDQKDPYTCGHSERVGFLARVTGHQLGLTGRQLQELEWGGLLHDIGKIGIPESILNKAGPLSDEEFGTIKHHPARGFSVLHPVESLGGVLDIVLHHHETPDGKGYPNSLTKDEIPLLARIVHVVDAFDALTSTRSYRDAFSYERAIEILRKEAGPKLDAEMVEAFLAAWERLPLEYPREYQRWFGAGREGGS